MRNGLYERVRQNENGNRRFYRKIKFKTARKWA